MNNYLIMSLILSRVLIMPWGRMAVYAWAFCLLTMCHHCLAEPLLQVEKAGDRVQGWLIGAHDGGDYNFYSGKEEHLSFIRLEGRARGGRAYMDQSQEFPAGRAVAIRVSFYYRGHADKVDGLVRVFKDHREISVLRWDTGQVRGAWQLFEKVFILPTEARKSGRLRLQSILYLRGEGVVDYRDYKVELLTGEDLEKMKHNSIIPTWEDVSEPRSVPFYPEHNFVSKQNPPDFRWPWIPNFKYDLQISRRPDFSEEVLLVSDLETNFYNFDTTFDPGVYFWRVRPKLDDKLTGEWSDIRKFRITDDAIPFPVPPPDELMDYVYRAHPRIWFTPEVLQEMELSPSADNDAQRKRIIRAADTLLQRDLPPEPQFDYAVDAPRTAEWIAAHGRLRTAGEGAVNDVETMACAYLITGDERYGRRAVEMLLNVARWNPSGATGYYVHDQVHRTIAWKGAVAYDWLYNLMTPEQRREVLSMIRARTNVMVDHLVQGQHPIHRWPHNSHGWTAYGFVGIIALATLHDEPVAVEWFRKVVPTYINFYPLWGDQDGGWYQGNGYWQYSALMEKAFMDALEGATGFSLYEKPYGHNSGLFPLYNLPHGSPRSHFGDENQVVPNWYHGSLLARLAKVHQDPVYQWGALAIGPWENRNISALYLYDWELPAELPMKLPPSRWFEDTGWVSMHSDLVDPHRISLYFKSSWIGSFNHSHADQNSFVLNAFGEALLIDSGYYDWYHSPHDLRYTRQTLAHNAVTVDGGRGQPVDDITAKGRIVSFVHHPQLDVTTGDATIAYDGLLERAERHIIYFRPDHFVIIDNLVAGEAEGKSYEWRFHTLEPVVFDEDNSGALIHRGEARLKLRMISGSQPTVEQQDAFIGPPNVYEPEVSPHPLRPQGRGAIWPDQYHNAFVYPGSEQLTLVSSLQPYREGSQPAALEVHQQEGVACLEWSDGGALWVNMQGQGGSLQMGDLSFDGAAVARTDAGAWLLVQGRQLKYRGRLLIESDEPITCVISDGEISVGMDADVRVRVYCENGDGLFHRDGQKVDTRLWNYRGNVLEMTLEPGSYEFRLRQPVSEGAPVLSHGVFQFDLDGIPQQVEMQFMPGGDGELKGWGLLDLEDGFYRVDECSTGIHVSGSRVRRDVIFLGKGSSLFTSGDPESLRFAVSSVPVVDPARTNVVDPEDLASLNMVCRIEGGELIDYGGLIPYAAERSVNWWGASPGYWMEWEAEVKRAGEYYLTISCSWSESTKLAFSVNGRVMAVVPPPVGRGLQVLVVEEPVYLEKGKNSIVLWSNERNGSVGWIGVTTATNNASKTQSP